jgi:hypothetical protein
LRLKALRSHALKGLWLGFKCALDRGFDAALDFFGAVLIGIHVGKSVTMTNESQEGESSNLLRREGESFEDWKKRLEEGTEMVLAMFRSLARLTHAAYTLWICSFVGERLQNALTQKMRPISNNFQERIFENYGPLSSFSSRIDLAYAFSILDDETFGDLKVIREIRNEFAHPKSVFHLYDEPIAKIIRKFESYDKDQDYTEFFWSRCRLCMQKLGSDEQTVLWLDGVFQTISSPEPLPDKSE